MQNEAPIDLAKCRLKIQRYCDKAERAPFDVEKSVATRSTRSHVGVNYTEFIK